MAELKPTKQQEDVLTALREYFAAKFGPDGYQKVYSLFLSAVAGAGKTTTILMIAGAIAEVEKEYGVILNWTVLSFNRAIMLASNKKLEERGARPVAKTTNSLGRGILDEASKVGQCRKPGKLDKFKYQDIIKAYCKKNARQIPNVPYGSAHYETEQSLTAKINKLVSAARLTYCDCASHDELADIVEHYDTGISLDSPYWPFIWQAVCPVINSGVELYQATGSHDFDDQLFLPLRLDVAAPIYDLIAVDEAQDLNRVRTELVKRSIKPNGCLFFVGDRRQAIQGFAFADTESVNNIIRDTQAVEMPLTCCWRCDSNIIKLAQAINPAIEARPGAPAGSVEIVDGGYIDALESGYWSPDKAKCVDADMVICRVTADLVKDCLRAIRNGKHATVRGRDIGRGIISLLDKILASQPGAYDLAKLNDAARDYLNDKAIGLIGKRNAEEEIDKLTDQIDTLAALVDGYSLDGYDMGATVDGLKKFIDSKFQDEGDEEAGTEGRRPIVFSTIHKAKGLETDTVYILRPEIIPHPMALKSGKAWQLEQEYNCLYVAVTRPKHTLRFVGGLPASLVNAYAEISGELDEEAAIEEAEEIINQTAEISAPEAEEGAQIAETTIETAASGKRPYGGRKPVAEADKTVPLQFRIDPNIKAAFQEFVTSLKDSGDFQEIIPAAGNSLSEADVLTQALLEFAPFRAYFETSNHSLVYADRLARQEKAREEYKNRKRGKAAQIAEASGQDDDPEPDPDGPDGGNGGGAPAPSQAEEPDAYLCMQCNRTYKASEIDFSTDDPPPCGHSKMGLFDLVIPGQEPPNLLEMLFGDGEEAPEPAPKIQRVAFQCLRPSCKHAWLTDYYIGQDGQKYRIDGGRTIYAANDFAACPKCGNDRRFIRKHYPKATVSSSRKCDSRCWNARPGSDCKCECGGANHGTQRPPAQGGGSTFIGQRLLVNAGE